MAKASALNRYRYAESGLLAVAASGRHCSRVAKGARMLRAGVRTPVPNRVRPRTMQDGRRSHKPDDAHERGRLAAPDHQKQVRTTNHAWGDRRKAGDGHDRCVGVALGCPVRHPPPPCPLECRHGCPRPKGRRHGMARVRAQLTHNTTHRHLQRKPTRAVLPERATAQDQDERDPRPGTAACSARDESAVAAAVRER